LLAWVIAAANPICGSGEACVRAASPVLHLATCLVVYATALELYGRQVAAWSAIAMALGTGLIFSARIISTDVPLIFFWAVALLAYIKLLPAPDWRWAMVLGAACGLGFLAKYAMVYFALCAICAAAVDRDARVVLARSQTWVAAAIAALIATPNVYWNFANHFVTFSHTGDNVMGNGFRLLPLEPLWFIGSQFGVAGPLVFAGFLAILIRIRSTSISREDRLMLMFALPPLALVTLLSFVRAAHANWAAVGLLSMTILMVAWWIRNGLWVWLKATIAIGVMVQATLLVGDVYAHRLTVPALGRQADLYRRTLGAREFGLRAAQLAQSVGAATVATEGRAEVAMLVYYLRNERLRVVSWPVVSVMEHHFSLTRPLDESATEPLLHIGYCPFGSRLARFYEEVVPLGPIVVSTGPTSTKQWYSFKLAKRRQPIEPLGPCVEAPPR
jgi:4-amino-4-deoxy-L-arabinose transferase-like glycosyltransferase